MKSEATVHSHLKTTKTKEEEIETKDTNDRNSPGSNQENDKHTNLGRLRNGKLSVEDTDKTAKDNVKNDDKISKSEATVDPYPGNANEIGRKGTNNRITKIKSEGCETYKVSAEDVCMYVCIYPFTRWGGHTPYGDSLEEDDRKLSDAKAMVGANKGQIRAGKAGTLVSDNQSPPSSNDSADKIQWIKQTKYPTHTCPKKLTDRQSMNKYVRKYKRAPENKADQDPRKLNHSCRSRQVDGMCSLRWHKAASSHL